jgi:hypothetical protein
LSSNTFFVGQLFLSTTTNILFETLMDTEEIAETVDVSLETDIDLEAAMEL